MSPSRIRIPHSLLSEHVETCGKPLCHARDRDRVVSRRADLAREVGNARRVLEPMAPRSGLPGVLYAIHDPSDPSHASLFLARARRAVRKWDLSPLRPLKASPSREDDNDRDLEVQPPTAQVL